MSIYRNKRDRSTHLPRASHFIDIEADLAANQFSYFFRVIKTFTVQLLKNEDRMSMAYAKVYLPSFDTCSYLLLKTEAGAHNKRASYLGFRENFATLFVLNYWLREFLFLQS